MLFVYKYLYVKGEHDEDEIFLHVLKHRSLSYGFLLSKKYFVLINLCINYQVSGSSI